MTRTQRRTARALATMVAMLGLTLAACKRKAPPAPPAPASTVAPSWTHTPAPPPSGPLSPVKGLDLCGKTDLTLLGDLKVKVEKKKSDTRGHGDAEAVCFFELRTATGRDASLSVDVTTLKSVEEAKENLRQHRRFRQETGSSKYRLEGSLSGIGDEADGFSAETDKKEYQEVEYMILARFENRIVDVWLAVYGKPLVPKATVAEKVRSVLEATAELASKHERGESRAPVKP